MPFLLAEILNFQGSTHRIGVGSFSYLQTKHMYLIRALQRQRIPWQRFLLNDDTFSLIILQKQPFNDFTTCFHKAFGAYIVSRREG